VTWEKINKMQQQLSAFLAFFSYLVSNTFFIFLPE
jgi:hypothetical protein